MYSNAEILAFDGTVQGLSEQLDLLKATMPKGSAFVQDRKTGYIINRVRVNVRSLSDGSHVWDIDLFHQE